MAGCFLGIKYNKFDHAFSIPSFVENLIDPVGSGDALLAYSSLVLYKTKSLVMASIIGSIAAACEWEKDGNIPIKIEEIVNKINFLEKEANFLMHENCNHWFR